MTEGKWQETPVLKLGPTDRSQFLEYSREAAGWGGGQPSQGLGPVLHGRVSKSTQAPAGLPASHRRQRNAGAKAFSLPKEPFLFPSLRGSPCSSPTWFRCSPSSRHILSWIKMSVLSLAIEGQNLVSRAFVSPVFTTNSCQLLSNFYICIILFTLNLGSRQCCITILQTERLRLQGVK